ncbi:unnamed protein product [Rotaria magnacalcarata]|uniref:Uncharacterized protein n=1 Tax=Rotaria magnacalcarata TaxID=392030 RepID=A0A816SMV2_9BILA|nr:unnamed protein product [Rotaria magnacalcarata]CAF1471444.1 unnamed protein product [Rotaria magnacalcarata]CAF2082910.1 unnamed protein product [Rotaria magnacalcarata]CAF2144259.1 unnamed protein product [Rotaria magnacalcarata]
MKPVLSVTLVLFLLILAVDRSSVYGGRINKRYYDTWETEGEAGNNSESAKGVPMRQQSFNKGDPCENKPLWFLKSQARLGKLSPFYDCLMEYGMERK